MEGISSLVPPFSFSVEEASTGVNSTGAPLLLEPMDEEGPAVVVPNLSPCGMEIYHMGTKHTSKQSLISIYDVGRYRRHSITSAKSTFLIYVLNAREPLLSNGSHTFKIIY